MRLLKALPFMLLSATSQAQTQSCPAEAPYWFQEILVMVVASGKALTIYNNPQPVVTKHCFATLQACTDARVKMQAFGFDLVLGSGLSAIAYVGRSTTECVQQ